MQTQSQSPDLTEAEVERAISEARQLDRLQRHKPEWDDYVSEGVIDHVPEPDADGNINAEVVGHENVVRMLQMNEEHYRAEADVMDQRADDPRRKAIKERQDEAGARKLHMIRSGQLMLECKSCSRVVNIPERFIRRGLRDPRCAYCGGSMRGNAAMRVGS